MATHTVNPGPVDPSLLTLQGHHVSEKIWRTNNCKEIIVKRSDSSIWKLPMHPAVQQKLVEAGFYGFYKSGMVRLDYALVTALVERWRPETHTFHLPLGEATITLHDIGLLWGLPVNGQAVIGEDLARSADEWRAMCLDMFGVDLGLETFEKTRMKLEPIARILKDPAQQLPDHPTLEQCEQRARMYIALMLGGLLVADTSGNKMKTSFLPLIFQFDLINKYSWGSAALATLYQGMCRATKQGQYTTSGPFTLLQFWAWERLRSFRPIVKDKFPLNSLCHPLEENWPEPLPGLPRAERWAYHLINKCVGNSTLTVYRDQLDRLQSDEFIWQPYFDVDIHNLPDYCKQDAVWLVRAPLICFDTVEYHYVDRVLRQFGMQQQIPYPPFPVTEKHIRGAGRRGKTNVDYRLLHSVPLAAWDSRDTLFVKVSNKTTWVVSCAKFTTNEACQWSLRAKKKATHGYFEITKYNDGHTCSVRAIGHDHINLDTNLIASLIKHFVAQVPEFQVLAIQAHVKNDLGVQITYKKAWYARIRAIEMVYGTWEGSYSMLPNYMLTLKRSNPGTIVAWHHMPSSTEHTKWFNFVFWSFHPSIAAFKYCRPVISIDGTHLRGKYKGHLLAAIAVDANNQILPLAFAIVDAETSVSWYWFLEKLFHHVLGELLRICIVSDRARSIKSAIDRLISRQRMEIKHRFCLRHLKSNFNKEFKNVALKDLCWRAGATHQPRKFEAIMNRIRTLRPAAFEWLDKIEKEQWTTVHDGDVRWGMLTTNSSECFNGAIKGARSLPITALVHATFSKVRQYFVDRKKNAEIFISEKREFPPKIQTKIIRWEKASHRHTGTCYDWETGLYQVTIGRRPPNMGENQHTLNYAQRHCTCGKWSAYKIPCSHAMKISRDLGKHVSSIIAPEYSLSVYNNTYTQHCIPLPHPDNWSIAQFGLFANPDRLRSTGRGQNRNTRIHNEMDTSDVQARRRCSRCRQQDHDARRCPLRDQQS